MRDGALFLGTLLAASVTVLQRLLYTLRLLYTMRKLRTGEPISGLRGYAAEMKPYNQDGEVIPIIWMGNLVCSNRRLQGVIKA